MAVAFNLYLMHGLSGQHICKYREPDWTLRL